MSNSNLQKYELEQTFKNHCEFHGRDERGVIKDKIYRGIFEQTLEKEGYTKKELKDACKQRWIKETYVKPNDYTLRKGYLWLEEEMVQRSPLKTFFDKIYRLLRGEYHKYYGKGELE